MSKRKEYLEKVAELDQQISILKSQQDDSYRQLRSYERSFHDMENRLSVVKNIKNRTVKLLRTIAAFLVGRRNLKHLYSKPFKIKHAMNRLKPYKYYLYNLGFIDSTLAQLKEKLTKTSDRYLRRAILWELGLWYTNEQSNYGAKKSLIYLYEFIKDETDAPLLRQGTILLVENLMTLGYESDAKNIINALLQEQEHPDLYFAMANIESELSSRVQWMNKVFSHYGLAGITFEDVEGKPTYENLRTKPIHTRFTSGPKVSVLIPAYNAETGIQIAIESMLNQTWKNIELIIIDDHSTDNTLNVIKHYAKKDNRITWFQTPENSGPYVARNIGLKYATGKYVTVNDADDWSHAEKLERQVQHLEANEDIIANTSEHARLTEELTLHRRGMPGMYIFSNMSSLLFRREQVLDEIGYWDRVRFAADGEFKRRLIKTFGEDRIIDLKTGPLSLPRQSTTSLTASSAFGYSGFFMGVRKEYVASFTHYHNKTNNLYYPFDQKERLFPVPEPMWIQREEKPAGSRHFEVVIAADFSENKHLQTQAIKEINVHKNLGIKTGIVLKSCYNMIRPKELHQSIREQINGKDVQTLVYGENITCDILVVRGHTVLQNEQRYLPNIKPHMIVIILDDELSNIRAISREVMNRYGKNGVWYAQDEQALRYIQQRNIHDLRYIELATIPWNVAKETYERRLKDWITNL